MGAPSNSITMMRQRASTVTTARLSSPKGILGNRHDLRVGSQEPYDINNKRCCIGLVWKQAFSSLRENNRWATGTAFACNKTQGLCYTAVNESIGLAAFSSW